MNIEQLPLPPCAWKMFTGFYCPGCGTGRALKSLLMFEFYDAFMYNPFLFLIIIPLLTYLSVIYIMRAVTKRWVPSILSTPKSVLPVMATIIGVWIFRNVFPLGLGLG
jgi:hypothetical protein